MRRSGGAIPPLQKGYLSDTCAIPYENKAKRTRYPLVRYYLEKVLRDMGGYLALGRSVHDGHISYYTFLGGGFDIFLNFFWSGRGKGESEALGGGGGSVFFWKSQRGGAFQDGRGRGAGRVSTASWRIWGEGRLNIFVRGRNFHQDLFPLSLRHFATLSDTW